MDIKQQIESTLNIDYVQGESLTLSVNDKEIQQQKRFKLWALVLFLVVVGLALAIQFTPMLNFDNQGIMLLVVFVLLIAYSIYSMYQNYIKTPFTFQNIKFSPSNIQVDNNPSISFKAPFEYHLILNQEHNRPTITIKLFDDKSVNFQLDSMQDFPIITDGIADILGADFKEHSDISEFEEQLTFASK